MGPKAIASNYKSACEEIEKEKGKKAGAPFETPKALLCAIREDFACLPHTAELVNLESANGMHKRTVDVHTLGVVEKLKTLNEFKQLSPELQDRVELAAFLHDIGKGPKSRWKDGIQKVDPDHPVRAMDMMVEILCEYVSKIKQENAELITKLVCYHDLVGEVLGKGRDEKQIVEIVKDETELQCLFALGKADSRSLVEEWWDDADAQALYNRCVAAMKERGTAK